LFPQENSADLQRLLAKVPVIRTACDLDLVVFLYRHPRVLLTSERLAEFVGYDLALIAKSLESLTEAGFLERSKSTTHAARMYSLRLDDPQDGGLSAILELASTRAGRKRLLSILSTATTTTEIGTSQGFRLISARVR
jgi:hypothetical protein